MVNWASTCRNHIAGLDLKKEAVSVPLRWSLPSQTFSNAINDWENKSCLFVMRELYFSIIFLDHCVGVKIS